jgi:hypothetical protein
MRYYEFINESDEQPSWTFAPRRDRVKYWKRSGVDVTPEEEEQYVKTNVKSDSLQQKINSVFKQPQRNEFSKDEYIRLLKTHDWHFQMSDDHRVYKNGEQVLNKLTQMQKSLDPDKKIWNQYAPK